MGAPRRARRPAVHRRIRRRGARARRAPVHRAGVRRSAASARRPRPLVLESLGQGRSTRTIARLDRSRTFALAPEAGRGARHRRPGAHALLVLLLGPRWSAPAPVPRPRPPHVPTPRRWNELAARLAPVDLTADIGAPGRRARRAGRADRRGQDHGRAVPAPGVGRERGAAARPAARQDAARPGAPARVPAEQGAVAAPRRDRAVPARRRPEAARRQLLSGGRDQGRGRGLDARRCRAPARAGARGLLHHDPPRRPTGALQAVPYSVEYQGELELAAALLRDAAAPTAQPTLRAFLEARAAAFLSNDYYDSDVAWMKLDASIEPTIGPYEVYEDGWFSAKAAFEAYVSRARRRRDREADEAGGRAAGDREQPARSTPSCATPSSARWRRSASSTSVLRGRRQQGGADRRVQPPQRRAHRQARSAPSARCSRTSSEAKFEQRADADQPDRARRPPTAATSPSTRSSRTS